MSWFDASRVACFFVACFSRRMLSSRSRVSTDQRRQSLRRATVFHTNKKMSEEDLEGMRKTSFSLPKALCFFIDTKENNVHTGFFAVSLLRSSSVCAYITGRAWLWSVLLLKELLLFSQLPSRRGLTTVTVVDYALPCGLSEATTRLGTNEEV